MSLEARRGLRTSAETVRCWWHALGWRGKRTKLVAKDNDGERAPTGRIRLVTESLRLRQVLLFADELDVALLPQSGYQWMPQGTRVEVLTPGKNEKHYLADGWDWRTGMVHYRFGARKTNQLFRDRLDTLKPRYPAHRYDRIYVVVDNYKIHKASRRALVGYTSPVRVAVAADLLSPRPSDCTYLWRYTRQDNTEPQTETLMRLGGRCRSSSGTEWSLLLSTFYHLPSAGRYGSPQEISTREVRCLNVRPPMWNDLVWVATPGEGIVTTYSFPIYAANGGTVFNTPFVSGAVAAPLSINSSLNQNGSAQAVAQAQPIDPKADHGRLDLY